jgi:hypothetical protein
MERHLGLDDVDLFEQGMEFPNLRIYFVEVLEVAVETFEAVA